jgi:hypothetical protein
VALGWTPAQLTTDILIKVFGLDLETSTQLGTILNSATPLAEAESASEST